MQEVYHLCFQYSNQNGIFIELCFLCMTKALNIFVPCSFKRNELVLQSPTLHRMEIMFELNGARYQKLYSNSHLIIKINFQIIFESVSLRFFRFDCNSSIWISAILFQISFFSKFFGITDQFCTNLCTFNYQRTFSS